MSELGDDAKIAARRLIDDIQAGLVPIKSGRDAAELLKALHGVARLEDGQVTNMTGTLALDSEGISKAILELQSRAQERQNALDDVPQIVEARRAV